MRTTVCRWSKDGTVVSLYYKISLWIDLRLGTGGLHAFTREFSGGQELRFKLFGTN